VLWESRKEVVRATRATDTERKGGEADSLGGQRSNEHQAARNQDECCLVVMTSGSEMCEVCETVGNCLDFHSIFCGKCDFERSTSVPFCLSKSPDQVVNQL
jgi:hypothetical protein